MGTSMRISYEQYEEMIRRGDFDPPREFRVELLYGEITVKCPRGPADYALASDLIEWSYEELPRQAVRIRVAGSIGIPALDSLPEPDLAWLRRLDYSARRPSPEDVLLLIEVADSSLDRDRGLKARLYAEAGIADYWIANIPGRCIEVRRDPVAGVYRTVITFHAGQEARPLNFPDVSLPVDRIFA